MLVQAKTRNLSFSRNKTSKTVLGRERIHIVNLIEIFRIVEYNYNNTF